MNKELTPLEATVSLRTRLVEKGIKDQFLEELISIENSLKALEIIKERLGIGIVILGDEPKLRITFQNMLRFYDITQEEYDLLKEVLL